jgi:hypothetical protein
MIQTKYTRRRRHSSLALKILYRGKTLADGLSYLNLNRGPYSYNLSIFIRSGFLLLPDTNFPKSRPATTQEPRNDAGLFVHRRFGRMASVVPCLLLEKSTDSEDDWSSARRQPCRLPQLLLAVFLTPYCASSAETAIRPGVFCAIQYQCLELSR